MTRADWRLAVYREMQADRWYEEPEPEPQPEQRDDDGQRSFSLETERHIPKSDRRRERHCVVCGTVLPEPSPLGGRRRVYCSNACRQRCQTAADQANQLV